MADTKFKPRDISGQRFHYLVALKRVGRSPASGGAIWECRCDCGNLTRVQLGALTHGHTYSCGCKRRELIAQRKIRHGHCAQGTSSPTYSIWAGMIGRCENPKDRSFPDYGGRGITVCARWRLFENFLADMGERPRGRSLDRIDNMRGYEPSNCRWATATQQANNTRSVLRVPFHGKMATLREVSDSTGMNIRTLRARIEYGVPHDLIAFVGDLRIRSGR